MCSHLLQTALICRIGVLVLLRRLWSFIFRVLINERGRGDRVVHESIDVVLELRVLLLELVDVVVLFEFIDDEDVLSDSVVSGGQSGSIQHDQDDTGIGEDGFSCFVVDDSVSRSVEHPEVEGMGHMVREVH
jgi:hypothetical protein